MASASNPVDEAFERAAVLRAVVSAARRLALSRPTHRQNLELGILKSGGYKDSEEAESQIEAVFSSIELLLDHVTILHMAATFEQAAVKRISSGLGVARSAIEKGRRGADRWPAWLLRDADHYKSLDSISALLSFPPEDKKLFDAIRKVRNELGHGVPVTNVPSVTAEETRSFLSSALDVLKIRPAIPGSDFVGADLIHRFTPRPAFAVTIGWLVWSGGEC